MSWTNERIELLQKLWLEGCSASRIAGELGAGVTRNAVIGKVFRLGLSGRVKAAAGHVPAVQHQKAARRTAQARAGAHASIGNTALALEPLMLEAPRPQVVADVVVPICEPVTIMDLRESMCRWPIGDPAQSEFRYCGAKKVPGTGPYCACHSGIAYQNHHERRQRPPQRPQRG
ncbi:MAG TPA: GcrA family cell cycle regulator [Methylocella sp.]|nr:GcrA family cell cycle regulator [Methylocella sp.]